MHNIIDQSILRFIFSRLRHEFANCGGYAAEGLDETGLATVRRGLDELYDQHLLTGSAPG